MSASSPSCRPRAGAIPSLEALQEHAGAHLARYKVPREVVFVDAIVRSPSGKPDYRWAKTTAANDHEAAGRR